jgi:hypothetical protein
MKKYGTLQKKGFCSADLLRKGHVVHRSSNFQIFSGKMVSPQILGLWVSKDAEIYVYFKNINLPLEQNAPLKNIFHHIGEKVLIFRVFFTCKYILKIYLDLPFLFHDSY